MEQPEQERPVPASKLSRTPSWITLGFILGALFVLALPDDQDKSATQTPRPEPQVVRLERPSLTEIEAVFAEWSQFAVWENDITEVALWDSKRMSYSLFYEVLRNGDVFYFRSIPQLTRPVLTHGVPENAPLQYTETEERRREWLRARWEQSFTPEGRRNASTPPEPPVLELGTKPAERRE